MSEMRSMQSMQSMRSLPAPWNSTLFEALPGDARQAGIRRLFPRMAIRGAIPSAFVLRTLLVVDAVMVARAILIIFTPPLALAPILQTEALFVVSVALLTLARVTTRPWALVACALLVFALSLFLNLALPGDVGDLTLLTACGYALYRLPTQWSWPIATLGVALLMGTHGAGALLSGRLPASSAALISLAEAVLLVWWVAWSRRDQHVRIIELQATQRQLREQMGRAEQLAATRERARLARDMHDVLAHSLTVLSIQTQAARNLIQQPERLAHKLDEIASLVRESLAESRRVMSLWRETESAGHGDVAARLQASIDRFGERTGISCAFDEEGSPRPLGARQFEALQYALREACVNASRHGGAHHIHATVRWRSDDVALLIADDGCATPAAQASEDAPSGHLGLRGMRERATALGGSLEAGAQTDGGFAVTLTLPLAPAESVAAARLEEAQ